MNGIQIGDKVSKYPIIQGGMGVGVSMHNLAGNVTKEGGIGVLSAADIGYQEEDFIQNPLEANLRAVGKEIKEARKIAGEKGILGINIMVALNNYAEIVKEAVKEKIDLIISGAGLPKDLPQFVKNTKTKIAPIISSVRACKLITELWRKKYDYVPDMIVIEGPEAGGHLGFKVEELEKNNEVILEKELESKAIVAEAGVDTSISGNKPVNIEDITKDVVEYVREIEKETNKKIPVIAAGGIYDGKDIKKMLDIGADGVQMATRFVATKECDASEEFKNAYVNATKDDIKIIKSPVGMPGRAIYNSFLEKVTKMPEKIGKCYRCIRSCDLAHANYCITKALVNAVKGNLKDALIFCGSNAARIKEIVSVHDLMQELVCEL